MPYIVKRVGQALIVMLLTYTLAFFLLSALPSDGVMARYADPALGLSQAEIEAIRSEMGVDKPLLTQYVATLTGLFTGSLGYSVRTGTPVRCAACRAAAVGVGRESTTAATSTPAATRSAASAYAESFVVAITTRRPAATE